MRRENESDSWELGWISLFKRKICYFYVLVLYKRESPLSKFSECKQMMNEAWVLASFYFLDVFFYLWVYSTRSRTLQWRMSSKTREFGCTTMSAELMTPWWLYSLFNGNDQAYVRLANTFWGMFHSMNEWQLNVVLEKFSFDLKLLKTTVPDGSLSSRYL